MIKKTLNELTKERERERGCSNEPNNASIAYVYAKLLLISCMLNK
jgi:hypothetical protein